MGPCWAQSHHDINENRKPEMKLQLPLMVWVALSDRVRGMFNLNDSRWGRGEDKSTDGTKPEAPPPGEPAPPSGNHGGRGRGQGPNQGPPDLDELWRDFNRKLGGLLVVHATPAGAAMVVVVATAPVVSSRT